MVKNSKGRENVNNFHKIQACCLACNPGRCKAVLSSKISKSNLNFVLQGHFLSENLEVSFLRVVMVKNKN